MRMLAMRKGFESFAERTRDRWGDCVRRWRARSRDPMSLRMQAGFHLERARDWWATIRAEGGLWVVDGRPRVLTHLVAAVVLMAGTAGVTWEIAARQVVV